MIDLEAFRTWLMTQTYDLDEHHHAPSVVWWNLAITHVMAEAPRFFGRDSLPRDERPSPARDSVAGTTSDSWSCASASEPHEHLSPIERGLAELRDAVVVRCRDEVGTIDEALISSTLNEAYESLVRSAREHAERVIDDPDATTPRQRFDVSDSEGKP